MAWTWTSNFVRYSCVYVILYYIYSYTNLSIFIHHIDSYSISFYMIYIYIYIYLFILLNDSTRSQHVGCALVRSVQHLGLESSLVLAWASIQQYRKRRVLQQLRQHCRESVHGSGAVILEASRWAPTSNNKEHLGSSPTQQETTNTTTGKRKQVQQQTAREEKGRGLDPNLEECGGPSQERMATGHGIGTTNGSSWSSNRSTCLNTQIEAEATNVWWKLCKLWGVEVQVQSLHGHTRQHLPRSAVKSRQYSQMQN